MTDQVPTTIAGWRRRIAADWQDRFDRDAEAITGRSETAAVLGFGLVYSLAVIERYVDPEIAAAFAVDLRRAYESGDLAEWIWQWRSEDIRGLPLTLPFELPVVLEEG